MMEVDVTLGYHIRKVYYLRIVILIPNLALLHIFRRDTTLQYSRTLLALDGFFSAKRLTAPLVLHCLFYLSPYSYYRNTSKTIEYINAHNSSFADLSRRVLFSTLSRIADFYKLTSSPCYCKDSTTFTTCPTR